MTPIQRLNNLIASFPERDQGLMYKLLNNRKFEDLWELMKSSIYMARKHSDKYEADFTNMDLFKSELSSYMDQIGLDYYKGFGDDELIDI